MSDAADRETEAGAGAGDPPASSGSARPSPRELMEAAVVEMRRTPVEAGKPPPLVGAVVLLRDGRVITAHRAELRNGDHAEYTLFERKLPSEALDGAHLFVTLEPCAPGARSSEKTPCSQRVVDARVEAVWIGIDDPFPTVAGQGRAFLQGKGIAVNDFDADLQGEIRGANERFLAYAEEAAKAVSGQPDMAAVIKRTLAAGGGRIEINDALTAEVERLRLDLEGPLPRVAEVPSDYGDWLRRLAEDSAPLVRASAVLGFWGQPADMAALMRVLVRLTRWPITGGIMIFVNGRVFPALLTLYAAGTAAAAAGNFEVIASLLRARLPYSTGTYSRPDQMQPVPVVLNGPEVLDEADINKVLNIDGKRRTDYYAPASVYLQTVLRPLLKDLVPDDQEFERAFDTFEALLALRFVVDGGAGLPRGSYNYRGRRSFFLPGVPERLKADLEAEGPRWGPVAGKVFDTPEEAARALEEMVKRLGAAP